VAHISIQEPSSFGVDLERLTTGDSFDGLPGASVSDPYFLGRNFAALNMAAA
jgi:hypothetical protein